MNTKVFVFAIAAAGLCACAPEENILPEPPILPGSPETPAATDAGSDDSDAAATDAGDAGDAGPVLPALIDDPPSDEKTKAPTKAEWKTAPQYRVHRNDHDRDCKIQKQSEWLRISCESWGIAGISVVSGSRDGLDVGLTFDGDGSSTGGHVTLPIRRGDRRLILFMIRTKWSMAPGFVVSEQWLTGDKGPLVSILDV